MKSFLWTISLILTILSFLISRFPMMWLHSEYPHPRRTRSFTKGFKNFRYINRKTHATGGIDTTVPKAPEAVDARASERPLKIHPRRTRRTTKVFNNFQYINRKIHAAGGIDATVSKTPEAGRLRSSRCASIEEGSRAPAEARSRGRGQGP